jgi:hypothetical protein
MADAPLATRSDTLSATDEIKIGERVKVNSTAGPRLSSKHGTVMGASGKYCDAVRVLLDGSKTAITLHKKYLSFEAGS